MDSITTADVVSIVAIAICLLLSFFFSGSETALTASSRARMTALEGNGDGRARLVNRLMAQRERLIGALLLGNNLATIAASSLATGILLFWFGDVGIVYATVVMTVIIVVFSEVLPKTIAINHPDRASLLVARPIAAFVALLGPVTLAMEAFVRWVLRLVGVRLGSIENVLSGHDELRGAVDVLHREGSVVKADRDMFGGVLDLRELHLSDVMVHRTKMAAVNADDAPEEIVRGVLAAAYTRVPLWRGTPENIVGVLHVKDILRAFDEVGGGADKIDIASITLPPWFVPDTTTLHDQLRAFLRRKTHFALVVDEYGEVMGLVTLEDILEEIVGDIADEHDVALTGVRPQPDGSVTVDGGVPIRDLNRTMDWNLPDEGATTIAGLVIHEARLIPEAGQTFTFHGFRFQVLRKNRNRVTLIRIKPLARTEPAPAGKAA
ncbi:MAG TPA: HlyC/CorC family transporter [Xanthobacteraceae bacterium]|nr:HlyC/CorC family transporter [Xanthobacteraceae bacterium]